MHHLQLTLPRIGIGSQATPSRALRRIWLRNRRRLLDISGALERRSFEEVRTRFYDMLWHEAAGDVGATIEVMANGMFRIARGGRSTFVDRSNLMLDSHVADRLMLDKANTYRWLAAKGLRTVPSVRFGLDSLDIAQRFLAESDVPVVVKPSDGTGCGHGVTTGITDATGLRSAAIHAAAYHPRLLAERQLRGASYRLLFLDGQFLDAIRRDPPRLVGDGRSNVRQLVGMENERRKQGHQITALSPLVVDMECRNSLKHLGLGSNSIPARGETFNAKLAVNENASAQNHVVRDDVHPEIIAAGERVAKDLRIGVAGLDVTATDIAAALDHPDTVFNEINIGAGLHHHYLVAEPGRVAHVAPRILEHIFATGHGAFDL